MGEDTVVDSRGLQPAANQSQFTKTIYLCCYWMELFCIAVIGQNDWMEMWEDGCRPTRYFVHYW